MSGEEGDNQGGATEISIDDFVKLDIRTALVREAALHPDADRLLVLTLDDGGAGRTVCAGIRQWWEPADLVGKTIMIVANLKPRKVRGVLSEGMILAVEGDGDVVPLTTMKPVAPGLRAR